MNECCRNQFVFSKMSKFLLAYLSRFEFFNFERWQSKRRTVEISADNRRRRSSSSIIMSDKSTTSDHIKCQAVTCKPYQVIKDQNLTILKSINANDRNNILNCSIITTCPSLIYLLLIIILLMSSQFYQVSSTSPSASTITAPRPSAPKFKSLLTRALIENSLARDQGVNRNRNRNRDRWLNVEGPMETIKIGNEINRRPYRNLFNLNNLRSSLNRLSNRIGARNTIRVHNAFRDLAWRLLSRFSMPTPVIYELRRQHLYSREDDLMNDSLFNKNTSKTIRSRRSNFGLAARQDVDDDRADDNSR